LQKINSEAKKRHIWEKGVVSKKGNKLRIKAQLIRQIMAYHLVERNLSIENKKVILSRNSIEEKFRKVSQELKR